MKRSKKQEPAYTSMDEYDKRFFPSSFKKRVQESMDADTLAVSLADESLERIRRKLVK